jgi:hypothetical protein
MGGVRDVVGRDGRRIGLVDGVTGDENAYDRAPSSLGDRCS